MLAKSIYSQLRRSTGIRSFGVFEKTFMANDLIFKPMPDSEKKPKPGPEHQYIFGGIQTDYMLEIDYDRENGGWQKPQIVPNRPF
jgi:hypothetical protein